MSRSSVLILGLALALSACSTGASDASSQPAAEATTSEAAPRASVTSTTRSVWSRRAPS